MLVIFYFAPKGFVNNFVNKFTKQVKTKSFVNKLFYFAPNFLLVPGPRSVKEKASVPRVIIVAVVLGVILVVIVKVFTGLLIVLSIFIIFVFLVGISHYS